MSEFSNQISEVINAYGSATALGNLAELHHTIISRLAKGKNPDPETLRKICVSVTDAEATKLLVAYFSDNVPGGCRHLVKISAPENGAAEEPQPSFDDTLNKLRPRIRNALKQLARICLQDDEFAEYVYNTTKLFDPDWAKAEEVIETLPTASSSAAAKPAASAKYPPAPRKRKPPSA